MHYHEDGHGKFFLPLKDLVQNFGSKQEEQDIEKYLEIIKDGKGPLEIDALLSLSLQLHIGVQVLPVQTIRALQRWLKSIPMQKTSCLWRLCKSTKTPSSVLILLGWISSLPGRRHSSRQLSKGMKTPSSAPILLGRPSSRCQSQSK